MTKPAAALHAAADRYGDAKLAMERWQGPNTGAAWAQAVGEYTTSMREMSSAASSYATSTRAARKAETEEAA